MLDILENKRSHILKTHLWTTHIYRHRFTQYNVNRKVSKTNPSTINQLYVANFAICIFLSNINHFFEELLVIMGVNRWCIIMGVYNGRATTCCGALHTRCIKKYFTTQILCHPMPGEFHPTWPYIWHTLVKN